MRNLLINKIMKLLLKNKNYNKIEIITMKYGVEGTIMFFEKFFLILIISFILGITNEMLLFMFFYMWLKKFSGGVHAKSSIGCLILSTLIFICFPLISKYIVLNSSFKFIISLTAFLIFIIYSPADTHKKPIKKNRYLLKIKSLIVIDIYCIMSILLDNSIGTSIILSLIAQSFFITPIPYKIIGVPYANWKE